MPLGTAPATEPPRPRGLRRIAPLLLIALGLAGVVVAGTLAQTGRDSAADLPAYVEEIYPPRDGGVLAQEIVYVDMEPGYTGYLEINGVNVRDEMQNVPELGRIEYRVGEGQTIEALDARNCVIAHLWRVTSGEENAESLSWCFDAL